jgi:peptide/nickel transport system ATP-binding protein
MTPPVLEAVDLEIEYATRNGRVRALDAATLSVQRGEIVGLVGESGCGKTTIGMAAGRMLSANAHHVGGSLRVAGEDIWRCDRDALRRLRRDVVGFVFQNPVAALDPTMRIGRQMNLATVPVEDVPSSSDALAEVGMRDIARVLDAYPHELSGGMAQRVGIAMAARRRPRLLIADEPTAAVDATLRRQILELLVGRCRAQDAALLLLTHDLHAVAEHCERVVVMYGGRVVEAGATASVLARPKHPYTSALLGALPGRERPGERLQGVAGVPPVLHGPSRGCAFSPRCPAAMDRCGAVRPTYEVLEDRAVCCHLHRGESSPGPSHRSSERVPR